MPIVLRRWWLAGLAVGLGLYWLSRQNYLLFHGLAELVSIAIAGSVFVFVWNAREYLDDGYYLQLGAGFLGVSLIDLIHMLAYRGMGVFPSGDTNLPTQLWIAGRYLSAASWLAAPFLAGRQQRHRPWLILGANAALTLVLLGLVSASWFPVCYVDGQGLTRFKIFSEYAVMAALVAAMLWHWRQRTAFNAAGLRLLLTAMLLTILQEMAFTLYVDVYGALNAAGHLLKLTASLLVYRAFIEVGLVHPLSRLNNEVRQQHAALELSHRQLETLFDLLPVGVSVLDRAGRLVRHNAALERLLGVAGPDLQAGAQARLPHLYPDGLPMPPEARPCQRVLRGELAVLDVEAGLVRPDQTVIWTNVSAVACPFPEWGVLSVVTDISRRKQAEQALTESEQRFRAIIEQSSDGILLINEQGFVDEWNLALERLTGRTRAQVLGRPYWDVQWEVMLPERRTPEALDRFKRTTLAALQSGQMPGRDRPIEGLAQTVAGETVYFQQVAFPVRTARGIQVGSITHDITARKQVEQTLRQQLEVQQVIAEVSRQLVGISAETSAEILQKVLASLGRQLGVDRCLLFEYHTPAEAFTLTQAWLAEGVPPGPAVGSCIALAREPLFQRVMQGETVAGPLAAAAGSEPPPAETQSQVSVPLMREEGLLGVIRVDDLHQARAWPAAAVSLLEAVGGLLAGALVRLEKDRQIRDLNETLERRVQERSAEVQDLYDHAPAGYHSLDRDGKFVMINQTELDWLGYPREELLGYPVTRVLTEASQAAFAQNFPRLKAGHEIANLELEFVRKDGACFPGLLNAVAVRDGSGEFHRGRATVFDLTARKRVEQELERERALLRMVIDNLPDFIYLKDRAHRCLLSNLANARALGVERPEDVVGKTLADFYPAGVAAQYDAWDDLVIATGEAVHQENSFTEALSGRRVSTWMTRLPLRNAAQEVVGVVGISRDITDSKRAEEALRRANLELERALRLKDEFLANMSHELRTPLTGILMLSEVLLEQHRGPLTEAQQEALRLIASSGEHLLALINDLLDLSKIEVGKLELNLTPVPVSDTCQASLQFVRQAAQKKQIQLRFTTTHPDAQLQADARRLKQMLVNLLSNAVKFTPAGGRVELEVTVDETAGQLELKVTDTGIGLRPDDLPRLFQPFVQVDASLARRHEGVGLGLALVRRLAEAHGGQIRAESAGLSQGSQFTITLPYEPARRGPVPVVKELSPAPLAENSGAARLVLVADDNPINATVTADYLATLGYQVQIAASGLQVLEAVRAQPPALILMDIQMPQMDGLETLRRLRAEAQFVHTPIIAVTALAMPGDRERCLAAGATDYLSKPVRLRALGEMIRRLLA